MQCINCAFPPIQWIDNSKCQLTYYSPDGKDSPTKTRTAEEALPDRFADANNSHAPSRIEARDLGFVLETRHNQLCRRQGI
jgi:hypothetical protein